MDGNGARDALLWCAQAFILFMLFSFIGWCYEVGNDFVVQGGFHPRAAFAGPWCPIYGIGGLLIVWCFGPVRRLARGRVPGAAVALLVAAGIFLLVSAVELAASYACEALMGFMPWDYSSSWGNFQGRVAPEFTLRFVVGGLVFLYLLAPAVAKWAGRHRSAAIGLAAVLAALFLADGMLELAGVWGAIIPRGGVHVQ